MNFEDELRSALKREEPPSGFAGRVLRAAEARSRQPGLWQRLAGGMASAWAYRIPAAALLCLLLAGGVGYRRRHARVEAEHAKTQLLLALRIAGAELHAVQQKVARLASHSAQ